MKRSEWGGWLVVAACIGILYAIIAPVFGGVKKASQPSCPSFAKQQSLALLMYCQDNDGRFPLASNWVDATYPYARGNRAFQCDKVSKNKFGYAFDSRLSGKPGETLLDVKGTAVTFESENLAKNARSPGKEFATRHHGMGFVTFADGHVKCVFPKTFEALPVPAWQENEAAGAKGQAKEPGL